MNIAIVGAGITGLVAAYKLLKKGHKVVIYEKEPTIGGLAKTFEFEGTSLEIFYHHVFKTDKDFVSIVEELNIFQELMWLDSSVSIYYDKNLYPFVSPFDLFKFAPLPFLDRIRIGIVTLFLQKYKKWENLKDVSAYDWMCKYAGKKATEVIWEPLLKGKFNKDYKTISMAWLWARIHVRVNSRESILEREMLGYMKGSFQVFVDTLEKEIKNLGGEIKTNSNIKNFDLDKEGNVIINLDDNTLKYNKILFTIPSPTFSKLISKNLLKEDNVLKYKKNLERIKYLGAVCLSFTMKKDISDYYWHNINDLNSPFLVFINHTKLVKKDNYDGKYVYYLASYLPVDSSIYKKDKKDIEDMWFKYLEELFPKFKRSLVLNTYLFKAQHAQHVVDFDYYNNVPYLENPLKNVYLTNFSLIFPEDRGLNYAVREGVKIAEEIDKN